MGTFQSLILDLIDQDVFIREALARGIVNKNATARWLMNRYEIEASHETVLDALGKHTEEPPASPRKPAIDVLNGATIRRRGPLWLRSFDPAEGSKTGQEFCSRRIRDHPFEGAVYLTSSRDQALVAGEPQPEMKSGLSAGGTFDWLEEEFVEFLIQYREPGVDGTPPLAFILSNLQSCGIRPVFAVGNLDGLSVIVPEDAHRLTYELLIAVTRGGQPGSSDG